MKIVDSIVNTYAWIKLTSTSISNMKIENISDTTVEAPPATGVYGRKINISSVRVITNHVAAHHVGKQTDFVAPQAW